MSALSFSAAVAVRPAALNKAAKATRAVNVNTTTKAIGGFGPNMPKEDYVKKMEAKKKLIEANKAKAAAKKQGGNKPATGKNTEEKKPLFSFGKKPVVPVVEEKKSLFSFGKKPVVAKVEEKKPFFSFGKK